jgi:hypothetical protein
MTAQLNTKWVGAKSRRFGAAKVLPREQTSPVVVKDGRTLRRVRPDQIKDAGRWREQFLGATGTEMDPTVLHAELASGIEARAWRLLRDHENVRFKSFEHFCEAPRPYGLGSDPAAIQRLLQGLIGERQTALATSPPSNQGRRDLGPTSPQIGEKSKTTQNRLRAVQERAPAPVRKLYEARVLSLDEAASLSVRRPNAAKQATIAAISAVADRLVAEVTRDPTSAMLKEVKAEVLPLFPPPLSPVIRLQRQFEHLTPREKEEFCLWFDDVRREQSAPSGEPA